MVNLHALANKSPAHQSVADLLSFCRLAIFTNNFFWFCIKAANLWANPVSSLGRLCTPCIFRPPTDHIGGFRDLFHREDDHDP